MNDKFDSPRCRAVAAGELAKGLAQSVTRRAALKKFGVGLAGIALAFLGLAKKVSASPGPGNTCTSDKDCAYLGPSAFCGWCVVYPADGHSYKWKCCKLPA